MLGAAPLRAATSVTQLRTGLDLLAAGKGQAGLGQRVALLTHAGAVDAQGRRSVDVVHGLLGDRLTALLSPEHGLAGKVAAGEKVADDRDAASGLPIISLYGARREPPSELLERIDTLVIDLQDVGLRPFTYAATMADCLRAAARHKLAVLVLDRPNPLGGVKIDGPLVDPALTSNVGALPAPFRHGLTMGELARLIQTSERLECNLAVVQMDGWRRTMGSAAFRRGGVPFAPPSPNLRAPGAILAYAATVLIEGTNLSEGRGTARPFETVGAPWCDGKALAKTMSDLKLPGVRFAPVRFTPTASKHSGQACGGIGFTVRDEAAYDPLLTGLSLIAAVRRQHPQDFAFLEGKRPFFDLLIGQSWVRAALIAGDPPARIVSRWQEDAARFRRIVPRFQIYT